VRGLVRALTARCPVCGSGGIWRSYGQVVERCPGCTYEFSREEGYWAGALIVNMAFALLLFLVVFVGGMLVTWPDVPWNWLLVATVAALALGPALLYRQSKTVWVWLDQLVHPYTPEERTWQQQ
jgi:uncharacterized protein (DUF983 family)